MTIALVELIVKVRNYNEFKMRSVGPRSSIEDNFQVTRLDLVVQFFMPQVKKATVRDKEKSM